VNAFVELDGDRALASAGEVKPGDQRPFAGVPIAIKNLRAVNGLRLTYGCQLMAEYVSGYDHNVTRRLKRAGFVIVGTTTLPEYAILPTTEARVFGPTRNPWDLQRTPGGSSGGSATAVAAGMVPVAHGSDGGGSIRIPAACCGLVGLKPARGRISPAPEMGDSSLATDGALTRTVADTAAILDVLAGYEPGDATWAPPPPQPFAAAAERAPGKLRLAATTVPPVPDDALDSDCTQAVERAAELLRSLGHEVVDVEVPWHIKQVRRLFAEVFCTEVSQMIAASGAVAGRDPAAEDMEPMSWAVYSMAKSLDAVEGKGAVMRLQAFARRLVSFLAAYDGLLTPMLAEAPLPLGTLDTAAPDPMSTFTRSGSFTPFTPALNATGQPAISLPLYERQDGLPLAVHIVGRPAGEGALLALAAQLEAAQPWAHRRAPMAEGALARG
jgi:amidase